MVKEDYIYFNIDAATKEEALEFISDKAYELGVTDNRDGLLGDFLKREEEFSTGIQDEFAIPHAKSDHAKKIAIFYVTSKNPLEWETMDGTKVKYMFALIVPTENAGNDHLMMISKLATNLLEDEFKDTVKSCTDKSVLKEYLLKKMKEED